MHRVCLVSCVSSKGNHAASASDLYTSALFHKSSGFAASQFDRWYVLSAKHGLLSPDKVIEPYEMTLNRMPRDAREQWAETVFRQLVGEINLEDQITVIAGDRYREFLIPKLSKAGFKVTVPTKGLSIGRQLRWLNAVSANPERFSHLETFYGLVAKLRSGLGKIMLRDCKGSEKWPQRGIYFFFEPGETRTAHSEICRVVRVGTHAVSRNSRATLWGRLRTHRGTGSGTGNHRSSIFRLHVGAAMIAQDASPNSPASWGLGQSGSPEHRAIEEEHERKVSEYIGRMAILWLAIPDEAGPQSDRSYIEKNSIGLLSGPHGPLDYASARWLGNDSPNERIRDSGLWNVNYTDYPYDSQFLGVFEKYVQVTLGEIETPAESIAPHGWYQAERRRISRGQLTMFDETPR